ncbi:glycoside hydrolase family 32 protein [Lentithecium fluviatile CBS 122367]|uniref:Glycoside hydrolase family 32 protein n=1 Tax=Lentithecium fluviatile CBS 122367 TaxID=1168545 RepID=A0A6G1JIL1_9PLEO|nr:glycoside hydrolase family 32 protein [Lentithecium fluviatile CBS 122367]
MKLVSLFAVAVSALESQAITSRQDSINYNAAPPNLSTLANASLYDTWRPKAHVLPAYGPTGDPCMHYTDPATGLFHVGYLHEGASGATTDDLITYADLNPNSEPFIRAGGLNDPLFVFDGSVIEQGINGTPTLLYTSVSYLPIQWTVRYVKGSETQSIAIATDGGRNFTKLAHGPVIPSPPFAVNVTGFRDPFVFQNAQFDHMLDRSEGAWYTMISGGVHDQGPSFFLYRQYNRDPDFQNWEYLGQWWHEEANSTWTEGGWAGRWGFNFEVGNLFALDRDGYNPEGELFATLGGEWSYAPIVPQVSDNRDMIWAAGTQQLVEGQLKFEPTMAGKLDWGRSAYAAAGKHLPASSKASQKSGSPDRFITYLWLTGNLYGTLDFPTLQQNWTGSLLLPRELSVGYMNVVDNALSREKGSWRIATENGNGTLTLATLQQQVAREPLSAFRENATNVITQAGGRLSSRGPFQQSPQSKHYMLSASITFFTRSNNASRAGFSILSGPNEHTDIYYQLSNESIIIERTNTSAAASTTPGIDVRNEAGKLRLFDVPRRNGSEASVETLDLTIVVDGGIVEVHANDRFAISTWAWSWYEDSRDVGFIVEGGEVEFGDVTVWEGLVDAWPQRSA